MMITAKHWAARAVSVVVVVARGHLPTVECLMTTAWDVTMMRAPVGFLTAPVAARQALMEFLK